MFVFYGVAVPFALLHDSKVESPVCGGDTGLVARGRIVVAHPERKGDYWIHLSYLKNQSNPAELSRIEFSKDPETSKYDPTQWINLRYNQSGIIDVCVTLTKP